MQKIDSIHDDGMSYISTIKYRVVQVNEENDAW